MKIEELHLYQRLITLSVIQKQTLKNKQALKPTKGNVDLIVLSAWPVTPKKQKTQANKRNPIPS